MTSSEMGVAFYFRNGYVMALDFRLIIAFQSSGPSRYWKASVEAVRCLESDVQIQNRTKATRVYSLEFLVVYVQINIEVSNPYYFPSDTISAVLS